MSLKLMLVLAVVATCVGLLTGCGDDSSGESPDPSIEVTTSSISKAQFVKKANAICIQERIKLPAKITAYEKENEGSFPVSIETYTDQVKTILLPGYETEIKKIQDLGAPAGEASDVEAILTAQQESINEVADLESIKDVWAMAPHFGPANKLMKKAGLVTCMVIAEPKNIEGHTGR